jgi:hypothetical protein
MEAVDFTEVVGSTVEAGSVAVDFMAEVFAAGAASTAAAGFVAARSAEERDFAEGQDFAVEHLVTAFGAAAAFAVTASAAAGAGADAVGVGEDGAGVGTGVSAGAGRIGVGDTAIRTDITTRGGRRLITRPAMIPTTILTTTLRPPILHLPARIEIIHTGTTGR